MPPKQTVIDIDEDKLKSILSKVEARTPTKPKQGMTLREVIIKSKATINKALKRGYTYEEIAAILTSEGISIKGATLKQYLTESKSKKRQTETTASSQAKLESETASETVKSDNEFATNSNIEPEIRAKADTHLGTGTDTKIKTKSASKQDIKPEAKPKSVIRGKFADIPSNDEL
jgi:hypothetical protein